MQCCALFSTQRPTAGQPCLVYAQPFDVIQPAQALPKCCRGDPCRLLLTLDSLPLFVRHEAYAALAVHHPHIPNLDGESAPLVDPVRIKQTRQQMRLALHDTAGRHKVKFRCQDGRDALKLLVGPRHRTGEPVHEECMQPFDLGLAILLEGPLDRHADRTAVDGAWVLVGVAVVVVLVPPSARSASGKRAHTSTVDVVVLFGGTFIRLSTFARPTCVLFIC